jgi:hypothetical protein
VLTSKAGASETISKDTQICQVLANLLTTKFLVTCKLLQRAQSFLSSHFGWHQAEFRNICMDIHQTE